MLGNTLIENQELFVRLVNESWGAVAAGNSKLASKHSRTCAKLVNKCLMHFTIEQFLGPMLKHESPSVQVEAAGHLVNSECRQAALELLRKISSDSKYGLVSSTATAVLMANNISNHN